MSATYNWAYKPVVTNKYGITVHAGGDDSPGTATFNGDNYTLLYIALFGNDQAGNGSREYPLRTINGAAARYPNQSLVCCLASGVYREAPAISPPLILIGDGDVRVDTTLVTGAGASVPSGFFRLFHIAVTGSDYLGVGGGAQVHDIQDCQFDQMNPGMEGNLASGPWKYNIAIGKPSFNNIIFRTLFNRNYENCTFLNYLFTFNAGYYGDANTQAINACIFSNCQWDFSGYPSAVPYYICYCLFDNCTFKFPGESTFNSFPTVAALSDHARTVYGSTAQCFAGCLIADPLFNNAAIGDYTLAFNSPAKNLSYFGTYVGAKSVAYAIAAKSTEAGGGFDFSSNTNLTISDDSITLTNPALNAQVDSKVIVNLLQREIASLPSYGFNADRNGQYIDSLPDLAATVKAAGDTLAIPVPYLVESGAINYNNAVYQPGDRLTTVSGQTTFTTASSGVIREIIEAPQRHTIMARFSSGGVAVVSAGSALETGYWYYVRSGSVTYHGTSYLAEAVFKAVDTSAFSGTGEVTLAMSTESYQHYEPGIKPTTNNVGDSRTGDIIRGNGDPVYERGGLGVQEFPVNAKFIQIRYIIQVNNLKP